MGRAGGAAHEDRVFLQQELVSRVNDGTLCLKSGARATLVPLLLFVRDLDSRTRKPLLRATVKVPYESEQTLEQTVVPGFVAGGQCEQSRSDLEQDLAPSTRDAVEGALHHGQYLADVDSRASPQRDPRSR